MQMWGSLTIEGAPDKRLWQFYRHWDLGVRRGAEDNEEEGHGVERYRVLGHVSRFPPLPMSGDLGRGAGRDLCPRPQINRPRNEGAKAGNANMQKCMTGQRGRVLDRNCLQRLRCSGQLSPVRPPWQSLWNCLWSVLRNHI